MKCDDFITLIRHVTLWPWPLTSWTWTFMVVRASCVQTLCKIWAKSNNSLQSYWRRVVTEFVSELRYIAPFFNAGSSKLSNVENQAKFRTFWLPVKIRGGVRENAEWEYRSSILYHRTCGIHLMGGRCMVSKYRSLVKKSTAVKLKAVPTTSGCLKWQCISNWHFF